MAKLALIAFVLILLVLPQAANAIILVSVTDSDLRYTPIWMSDPAHQWDFDQPGITVLAAEAQCGGTSQSTQPMTRSPKPFGSPTTLPSLGLWILFNMSMGVLQISNAVVCVAADGSVWEFDVGSGWTAESRGIPVLPPGAI